MRAIIQRVLSSSVTIDGSIFSSIEQGLLVLLGVTEEDSEEDVVYLVHKIAQMRIFGDAEGKMNLSVMDIEGEVMVISQFTLFAQTKKGNRPSFILAAKPNKAIPLYTAFILEMDKITQKKTASGVFGADMKVQLINDGPVTIFIDSKLKDI
jgi:D-tyrosyl-tRNA(Tyr) deacylase